MKTLTLNLLIGCLAALLTSANAQPVDESSGTPADAPAAPNVNTATLNCLSTVFKYALNVTALQPTNCTESSPLTLNDASWTVKFCRGADSSSRSVLDVFLISNYSESTAKWSSSAQATFKLLHKNGRQNETIEKELTRQKYSSLNSSVGIKSFVRWSDLLNDYTKDNKSHFEIEISTDALSCSVPSQMEQSYTQLHIVVDDVSKVTTAVSPVVVVRGIKFNVVIAKDGGHLSVNLKADVNDLDINWIYHANVNIRLLPFDGEPIEVNDSHDITWAQNSIGVQRWMTWADFVAANRSLVVNDKANFIVEFSLAEPTSAWGNMGSDAIEVAANAVGSSSGSAPASNQPITLMCIVCREPFGNGSIYTSECGHLFCRTCFDQTMAHSSRCPMCRSEMRRDTCYPLYF